MVAKKIEVTKCADCPYMGCINFEYHCDILGERDTTKEYESDTLPDWCPLEDA